MVRKQKVNSLQGADVTIKADTICIYGDGVYAVKFAKQIFNALTKAGIRVNSARRFLR